MTGTSSLMSLANSTAAAIRGRRAPWVIFVAALTARLLQIFIVGELPTDDTPDYDEIALNLLSGDGFVSRENWFGFEMYSWRAPAYPFLLAAIYAVFGYTHTAALTVQALIGAATAVVVYDLGRRLHPPSAFLAGGIAAAYEPLIRATSTLSTEPLFILLSVTAVQQLLVGLPSEGRAQGGAIQGGPGRFHWVLCGVITGAAALTRPVGLVLLPVQVGIWYWRDRAEPGRPKVWIRRSLWLSLGIALTITPWTLRNYHIHGQLVPISTHGGFIFARSNAAEPDWKKGGQAWRIDQEFFVSMPTETARNSYWVSQGTDYIRSNPAHYLRLVGERLLRFWYFFESQYNFWFMSLLPFFVAGLARFGSHDRYALLTTFMGVSLAVFCLVLYASVRFRLALEPFFILYASSYIRDHWDRFGAARTRRTLALVLAVNGIVWWQDEALRQTALGFLR